jgi:7-cyano-7-deazaguanine synthase
MKEKIALVVLSGGQDSTTCLYLAKANHKEVHAVTFDYGQRHAIELEAARKVARMAKVMTHEVVSLGPVLKGTSPLVSNASLEQYADHKSLPGGLEKTFVPMRNQLFLTIAVNRAVCLGAVSIYTGVGQEDYGGYPDCRKDFIRSFQQTCFEGLGHTSVGVRLGMSPPPFAICTPLMNLSKAETVDLALMLPGCYGALAWSHTSYDGQYPPVGHDHATLLRAKGFEQAGVPDPLVLRAHHDGLMDLPTTENYSPHRVRIYTARLSVEGGLSHCTLP